MSMTLVCVCVCVCVDAEDNSCESGDWLVPTAVSRPPPLMWKKLCVLLDKVKDQGGLVTAGDVASTASTAAASE